MLKRRSSPLIAGPVTRGLVTMAAGLAIATAQTLLPDDIEMPDEEDESENILEGSLLPDGSILNDVVIPSYEKDERENLKLTSTMSAKELVIVTKRKIQLKELKLEFFNPDASQQAMVTMEDARFLMSRKDPVTDEARKFLLSDRPVFLTSDKLRAEGAGIAFHLNESRGFLHGPAKVVAITTDTRISMNAKPARHALAAGALLMASVPALPAQEKPRSTAERFSELRLTPEELDAATAEAASQGKKLKSAAKDAEATVQVVKSESNDARITMNSFLQAVSLASLIAAPAPAATGDVPRPEVEKDPTETTITSKDGAYFDAKEGLLIFLKDVVVKNPQFQLKGADEVKAFMEPQKDPEIAENGPDGKAAPGKLGAPALEKKAGPEAKVPAPEVEKEITPEMAEKMLAAKAAAKKEGKSKLEAGAGAGVGDFGDMKRIVATGTVVVDFTPDDPEKSPVKASARTVIYDFEKEMVILRGGSPWIVNEGKPTIVKGDDAYIFIYMEDGEPVKFVTGNQEMFETTFKTPEDEKEAKKPKKP